MDISYELLSFSLKCSVIDCLIEPFSLTSAPKSMEAGLSGLIVPFFHISRAFLSDGVVGIQPSNHPHIRICLELIVGNCKQDDDVATNSIGKDARAYQFFQHLDTRFVQRLPKRHETAAFKQRRLPYRPGTFYSSLQRPALPPF